MAGPSPCTAADLQRWTAGNLPSSRTQLQVLPTGTSIDTDAVSNMASNAVLMNYFWETLITNGIPAAFSLLVVGFGAFFFRPRPDPAKSLEESVFGRKNPASVLYQDLYGDQDQTDRRSNAAGKMNPLQKLFNRNNSPSDTTLPQNVGIPANQYIRLTHLNKKYDSYQYSLTAATQSRAAAAKQYRQVAFARAWTQALAQVPLSAKTQLQRLQQEFLQEGLPLLSELQALQTQLTQLTLDTQLLDMLEAEDANSAGMSKKSGQRASSIYKLDPATNQNETATADDQVEADSNTTTVLMEHNSKSNNKLAKNKAEILKSIATQQKQLQELELDFVQKVVQLVGADHAVSIRTALLGDMAVRGSGSLLRDLQDAPLQQLLGAQETPAKMFVAGFPGDPTASQVETLREEATAIIGSARKGVDEVLIVLQSGGGTVTGYGLAAAQLLRFKQAGLKLTIAVEQVAASGGYMMCCVADHIVASPFAVLGSIGVISDIPNVYERLKQEGIEFQTVTAGKFKRTLTPTKKVTKEDFAKTKQDVEEILVLFRDFVAENRPQLDMDKVATGETWFGSAALDRKLCDEIKTVDDVIMEAVGDGYDVYDVEYVPPVDTVFGRLTPASATVSTAEADSGLIGEGVRWLVRTIATEIKAELGKEINVNKPLQERYMVQDNTADRIKSLD